MSYRRRNRVLCLHGPTQSSASFRAALKPVCDRLASHWEFHFLDAPFIIPDEDGDGEAQRGGNVWSNAAILASQLVAIDAEWSTLSGQQTGSENAAVAGSSSGSNNKSRMQIDVLQKAREAAWTQLSGTEEGRKIWEAQQQMGGADAVESLLSTKVAKSMSRSWTVSLSDGQQVGIDVGLGTIGDYMREQGTMHAIIGCDSGSSLAFLLQSLLSHPRSGTRAFPSFFAQLPTGVKRMPRMGGWEEEPPPPDDARLGAENLPKNYVPAQKPFEALIALHLPSGTDNERSQSMALDSIGLRAAAWVHHKKPVLRTEGDGFANHSLSVGRSTSQSGPQGSGGSHTASPSIDTTIAERRLGCAPSDDIFDRVSSAFLASWLTLAIESCAGSSDAQSSLAALQPQHGASDGHANL